MRHHLTCDDTPEMCPCGAAFVTGHYLSVVKRSHLDDMRARGEDVSERVSKNQMLQAIDVLRRVAEMTQNAQAAEALEALTAEADDVERESDGHCMREGYILSAVVSALT